MKKILFVIGTRPEIIKTAPVVRMLKKSKKYRVKVCFTGQHRSMVDQMLKDFDLSVDYDLKIMRRNQSLAGITSRTLRRLKDVYREFRPDMIFVQGDTTSAMATSLSAFYQNIKLAHIEAGLRTYDKYRPYPEEINRVLISHLADLHFAPTKQARDNLRMEGIKPSSIYVSGNTVIDALLYMKKARYQFLNPRLKNLPRDKKIILVTMHRRESFGKPLKTICRTLKLIVQRNPEALIIYPVHLNPNVFKPVKTALDSIDNIWLLPPLHYRDLINLISKSYIILTDSGGIQEESPSFGKPVLVLREKTERPEGVKLGIAKLVGSNPERIIREVTTLWSSATAYEKMTLGKRRNPYGDGEASERIVLALDTFFSLSPL